MQIGRVGCLAARSKALRTMKLHVKRLDREGRYETLVVRGDGVKFHLQGVAHTFAIPHDLAHYLVEKSLKIEHGFWGLIGRGAVFPTMRYLDGRRKPKAAERSRQLMKTHARDLVEAEVMVRIINDTFEQGRRDMPLTIARRVTERLPDWGKIDRQTIMAIHTNYKKLKSDWVHLPPQAVLTQDW